MQISKINKRIILALDVKDPEQAVSLIKATNEFIAMIKIGLEFFVANGPEGLRFLRNYTNIPIFLDLKLMDIPNTVKGAVEAAADLNVKMLTLHISGGKKMLEYAVKANKNNELILVGVTVLTSLTSSLKQVMNMIDIAIVCGVNAVVCSALEVKEIKKKYPDIITIVPGISLDKRSVYDQTRTALPKDAIENGADFLVIGRAITASADPRKSARNIAHMIYY